MKKLTLLSTLVFITACMTVQPREFDPRMCNKNASFEAGYNDGRYGHNMDSQFLNRCRDDLREKAQTGYREGFEKGHSEFEKMVQEQRKNQAQGSESSQSHQPPSTQPVGPNINVNIGGVQSVGGSGQYGQKAWYCEVKAFMKKFDGFGPTEIEAKRTTKANCQAEYHEMHCSEIVCQPNK